MRFNFFKVYEFQSWNKYQNNKADVVKVNLLHNVHTF